MRNIWKYILLGAISVLASLPNLSAQYKLTGSEPAGISWRQISGEHFDVIYPSGTDSLARRYLYLFEKYRHTDLEGLQTDTPKLPIVLHPYNINSNGMVVWAPKRIEIETTPSFNSFSSQNWETQLALHEGRHIGQMSIYTKGFFKVLYYLVGEQSIAFGVGLYPSQNILEGDAVQNETDFSEEGRGRRADFLKYYRASWLSGDHRSFQRWRLGSDINYTPNLYASGYILTSAMRYNSGNYYATGDYMNTQQKLFWRIFSNSSRSFREASGLTAEENWKLADSLYTSIWREEYEERKPFSHYDHLLTKRGKYYTEITNPVPFGSDVLVKKSGMDVSKQLGIVHLDGTQRKIRPFSSNASRFLPIDDSTILFSEVIPGKRWEHESFSIIRTYDLKHNRFRNITENTRYFNPIPGRDKSELFAVEYLVHGGSLVVEIDSRDGSVKKTFSAPEGAQIVEVALLENTLYATAITEDGLGIIKKCLDDAEPWATVVEPQSRNISDLKSVGISALYFVSALDGVDNIYSLYPEDGSLWRLSSSRFGAKDPYYDTRSKVLYYSEYDRKGYAPVSTPLDSLLWEKADFRSAAPWAIADSLAEQAQKYVQPLSDDADTLLFMATQHLESTPYSKARHLFHVHSWAPVYVGVNKIMKSTYEHFYDIVAPGVTVISQNTLGTAVATAGYSYHRGFHAGHFTFEYSGFHPKIELSIDLNDRHKVVTTYTSNKTERDTLNKPAVDIKALLYYPMNLSRSGWYSALTPQLQYKFSNDEYSLYGEKYVYRKSLLVGANYYRVLPVPSTRIYPQWGFGANAFVRAMFNPGDRMGVMAYMNIYGYMPGIAGNHGLRLSACCQHQFSSLKTGYIQNIATLPRGYLHSPVLTNYFKFTADYAIPLYFVDGCNTALFYLRRIQLIPFLDLAYDTKLKDFMSYGCDALLDFHPLRISYNISVGVRYSHTITNQNHFNFLLNLGI